MRTRLLAAALLLTAMPVLAQTPSAHYTFAAAEGGTQAVAPGSMSHYNFTVERTCALAMDILPETSAKVEFVAESLQLTVAGPGQVVFPQQVCAREPRVQATFAATVVVGADAVPGIHKLVARLHPEPSGPTDRYGNDAQMDFLVNVRAPPEPVVEAAGDRAEAPAGGALGLLAALGAGAVALRRRI